MMDVSGREIVARMVGKQKRVLHVSCNDGTLADLFASNGCTVVELEQSELGTAPLAQLLGEGAIFDSIIFDDILKYLRDPEESLYELSRLLAADGSVIGTVPNALHGAILLALLTGALDFRSLGVDDESHLHFLTAATIGDLFLAAGLQVEEIDRIRSGAFGSSTDLPVPSRGGLDPQFIADIERDPESTTVQFVIRGRPLGESERHEAILKRIEATRAADAATRRTLSARDHEIATLRSTIASMRSLLESCSTALASIDSKTPKPSTGDLGEALALAISRTRLPAAAEEISSELQRAIVRNEHLAERTDDAERKLADLMQGLIVATQAESARLALLIDTVQSSRFWQFKRWVAKLLHRGRR